MRRILARDSDHEPPILKTGERMTGSSREPGRQLNSGMLEGIVSKDDHDRGIALARARCDFSSGKLSRNHATTQPDGLTGKDGTD